MQPSCEWKKDQDLQLRIQSLVVLQQSSLKGLHDCLFKRRNPFDRMDENETVLTAAIAPKMKTTFLICILSVVELRRWKMQCLFK